MAGFMHRSALSETHFVLIRVDRFCVQSFSCLSGPVDAFANTDVSVQLQGGVYVTRRRDEVRLWSSNGNRGHADELPVSKLSDSDNLEGRNIIYNQLPCRIDLRNRPPEHHQILMDESIRTAS